MVWSRSKIMIQDELLKPRNKVFLDYHGPHPEKFYNEIPQLLMTVFRVNESALQEKKFFWTRGEPMKFKIAWEVDKDLDRFSYLWVDIKLEGSSPSQGDGTASITIEGAIRTEYPQDTFWQKSLLYELLRTFWHKTTYIKQRERFLQDGRRHMSIFIEELKRLTG